MYQIVWEGYTHTFDRWEEKESTHVKSSWAHLQESRVHTLEALSKDRQSQWGEKREREMGEREKKQWAAWWLAGEKWSGSTADGYKASRDVTLSTRTAVAFKSKCNYSLLLSLLYCWFLSQQQLIIWIKSLYFITLRNLNPELQMRISNIGRTSACCAKLVYSFCRGSIDHNIWGLNSTILPKIKL